MPAPYDAVFVINIGTRTTHRVATHWHVKKDFLAKISARTVRYNASSAAEALQVGMVKGMAALVFGSVAFESPLPHSLER